LVLMTRGGGGAFFVKSQSFVKLCRTMFVDPNVKCEYSFLPFQIRLLICATACGTIKYEFDEMYSRLRVAVLLS
jgi:hypothetical protein